MTTTQTGQGQHVIGVYASLDEARQAVEQLREQGVPLDDVSIVLNLENETTVSGFVTAAETAKEGVRLGALSGGLFGLLSGAAFLFVPGVGPLAVIGPLASTLIGAGEGAILGGAMGAVFGKIMEKKRIPKYEQHLKDKKYLVVVRSSPDRLERIRESMQGSAASEVETEAAAAA
jgi:hypothetical protein